MKTTLLLAGLLFVCEMAAQTETKHVPEVASNSKFKNIVMNYRQDVLSIEDSTENKVPVNPVYFPLFSPLMLYSNSLDAAFGKDTKVSVPYSEDTSSDYLGFQSSPFQKDERLYAEVNDLLIRTYMANPSLVMLTEWDMQNVKTFDGNVFYQGQPQMNAVVRPSISLTGLINDTTIPIVKKPNYWTFSGNMSIQFSQNYFSDNWYKGGESNNSMLTELIFNANYQNDRSKIKFENKLEAKLGYYISSADTCHPLKTNNDLLRFTTTLKRTAFKNFNYTLQAQAYTQFLAFYDVNATTFKSNFMAPFYANISIGMEYNKSFKKANISVLASPLTYYYRFVRYNSPEVDGSGNITQQGLGTRYYGIRQGRHHLEDLGGKVEVNSNITLMENVTWKSRLFFFTSYERVESEWENTINFKINKYLSSQFFFHVRFDDNVGPANYHHKYGYFQYKEFFTLGLSYALL